MKDKCNKICLLWILLIITLTGVSFVSAADWYKGELHVHTIESSVLGGCPKEILSPLGYSVSYLAGNAIQSDLKWQSYTDHSYCLDNTDFNEVKSDCNSVNSQYTSTFACLSGEELSVSDDDASSLDEPLCIMCLTSLPGVNCGFIGEYSAKAGHVGAHGIDNFISQDSSVVWCPNSPSAQGGIISVNSENGLSIINHPEATNWDFVSLDSVSNYEGIEIWNGEWDGSDGEALSEWIKLLLKGNNIFAYGGTDTHSGPSVVNSNFVYANSLTASNVKTALSSGKTTVSNNGLVYLEAKGEYQAGWTLQGGTTSICSGDDVQFKATYQNVPNQCTLIVYKGRIGQTTEDSGGFSFGSIVGSGTKEKINYGVTKPAYYRAQCTSGDKMIYTNPVWINIDTSDSDWDGICDSNDCSASNKYIYPINSNQYCNCDSSDGKSPTTEILGDGLDNDCDGQTDEGGGGPEPSCINGQTKSCLKQQYGVCKSSYQTCTNGNWPGCNYGTWAISQGNVYESSETICNDNKDNDCDGQTDECVQAGDCEDDETPINCVVKPMINSLVEMWIDSDNSDSHDAKNILKTADPPVCGIDKCIDQDMAAVGFDIDDQVYSNCPTDTANWVNGHIATTTLSWFNDDNDDSCKDTFIRSNDGNNGFDESYLTNAGVYEDILIDSSQWDYVKENIENSCKPQTHVEELLYDIDDHLLPWQPDKIGIAWWPKAYQQKWWVDDIGVSTSLELDLCKPCPDVDNDGFSDENNPDGCGTYNDCNDNNANIFPGNSNSFCDCVGTYSEGRPETCDGYDDDCDGYTDEGCDDDNDDYCDSAMTYSSSSACPNGGGDGVDTNSDINPGMAEDCTNGIDDDSDSKTDCADSGCSGKKCSLCKSCSGGTCSGTPSDDSACSVIDCGGYYQQTGTEGASTTETCWNKYDIASNRCASFGTCKNAAAHCPSQPTKDPQYSCGSCTYINNAVCTGTTKGACSYYGVGTLCNQNYFCSNSAAQDNGYAQSDFKRPSEGYCDTGGSCDYVTGNSCNYTKGTASEGGSICVDGQSSCSNTCADNLDNDGDSNIDCDDSDCSTNTECVDEICNNGIDDDSDNYIDCADAECMQGTPSQNGFCCGSGCSNDGGTCQDASTGGFTCSDGNCNTYGEACQNGELESNLVCSGTSLSCSGGNCEANNGAPSSCDEKTPGDTICETGGSFNERACELSGTNCYLEGEFICNAPNGCDEKTQDLCSTNSGFQCEWAGAGDNVIEECEATGCGAVSQCDELLPGDDYASCTTAGMSYFADQCSSSCQGEERGDNICRSSYFATGCTAASNCNTLSPGTDLNTCNQVGQTYYEDECSNSCQYTDITPVFECSETGCSCNAPQCDGLTTGSNINTCTYGATTYFADKCTSTAGGEDRGDNICRSSAFAASCTADSQCNGIEPGGNGCTASCVYDPATEAEGDVAIEQGISNSILTDYTIHTNQQIYARYPDSIQMNGRFDKVVMDNKKNQTWAFNYVTAGESFTNLPDLYQNSLVVWEGQNLLATEITSQVQNLIDDTKWD